MNPEIIGFLGGFCITVAYVPQALKTLKSKDTSGLSLGMYVLVTLGNGFWFTYGVMIGSPSVIIANIVTFSLTFAILLLKLRHG